MRHRRRKNLSQTDLERIVVKSCPTILLSSDPRETLLERSFEFLLERESNTSILRRFDLPVIGSYFPEYERTIRGMLAYRRIQQPPLAFGPGAEYMSGDRGHVQRLQILIAE